MNETLIERVILFIVIALLLFALVKYKLADYKKKRAQKKRFARGNQLETEARSFLENKGYNVVSEQEIHYHRFKVNGEYHEAKLILDYVVSKGGKTYIVEVKSGKNAIYIKDKNTRRQILEYDFVIENDGVFLLDMENKKMQLVNFHTKVEKKEETFRRIIIVLAIIGILIPFWKVRILLALIMFLIWRYPDKVKKVVELFIKI